MCPQARLEVSCTWTPGAALARLTLGPGTGGGRAVDHRAPHSPILRAGRCCGVAAGGAQPGNGEPERYCTLQWQAWQGSSVSVKFCPLAYGWPW